MNSRERQLDRLFKSARNVKAPLPALTWSGEARVLAAWRKTCGHADVFNWLPLLHRAVALACVVAIIAAAASMTLKPNQPQADELTALNESVNAAAAWL